MNRRRAIAVLALLGALDATYLLLGKLGITSGYVCSVAGGCEVVNTSPYSEFLGIPVAAIGAAGYLAILVVALAAIQPRWLADRRPDLLLGLLSGVAVAFSLYLTYVELFVLRALCQWCMVSQALIIAIFVLALVGVRSSVSNSRQPTLG
ncbi:MAG: hypothetical protein GTO46_06425 [Gemmatimonadetes bacterium]|nr:hypothetical protein [Gemmatimonadota bacterium]NIO31271.1 hypothetical protein [Gemmatimonadota bacterium]